MNAGLISGILGGLAQAGTTLGTLGIQAQQEQIRADRDRALAEWKVKAEGDMRRADRADERAYVEGERKRMTDSIRSSLGGKEIPNASLLDADPKAWIAQYGSDKEVAAAMERAKMQIEAQAAEGRADRTSREGIVGRELAARREETDKKIQADIGIAEGRNETERYQSDKYAEARAGGAGNKVDRYIKSRDGTRVEGALMRDGTIRDLDIDASALPEASKPEEYPDAVWDAQRGVWTVKRNGKTYAVE